MHRLATHLPLMGRWKIVELQRVPAVRTLLFCVGILLMLAAPLVGVLPGPGGIIVFAAGLTLTLKYSDWAKRKYVAFKRKHPKKGRWADWGLRRQSAARRETIRKEREAQARETDCSSSPLARPATGDDSTSRLLGD